MIALSARQLTDNQLDHVESDNAAAPKHKSTVGPSFTPLMDAQPHPYLIRLPPPKHQLDNHGGTSALPQEGDVVIVGAGFAGLVCVCYICQQSPLPRTTILEARDACSGATARNGTSYIHNHPSIPSIVPTISQAGSPTPRLSGHTPKVHARVPPLPSLSWTTARP
ncbi:hypothetical protein J3459_017684 [Metarhizium acridum]|nr:hypothetical protein J3459_017684 [Metarhizium acridum]